MNDQTQYSIITIDPTEFDIGPDAPLRVRRHLPGEPGENESDRQLTESILLHGMLQPPLLVHLTDASHGKPLLVQGFRRVAAAQAAEISRVDAVLRTAGPERSIAVLLWWLAGIAFGEPLSNLERILLIEKAYAFTKDVPLEPLSAAYGKTLSAAHLKSLRNILELDDPVLEALHRGRVSTGDLLQLIEHPAVDTSGAAGFLAGERLTRGEQKKAVRLMLRIGDGGTKKWKRFAESYAPGSSALLVTLERICHPTFTRDRARIEKMICEMHLPPGVSIKPPENMEGGAYRLQMPIRDEEAFNRALEKLQAAVDAGKVAELIEILRGGEDS